MHHPRDEEVWDTTKRGTRIELVQRGGEDTVLELCGCCRTILSTEDPCFRCYPCRCGKERELRVYTLCTQCRETAEAERSARYVSSQYRRCVEVVEPTEYAFDEDGEEYKTWDDWVYEKEEGYSAPFLRPTKTWQISPLDAQDIAERFIGEGDVNWDDNPPSYDVGDLQRRLDEWVAEQNEACTHFVADQERMIPFDKTKEELEALISKAKGS